MKNGKKSGKNKKDIDFETSLKRALADYDNLTKRVEREREDYEDLAKVKIIMRLLPILDMLDRAREHSKDTGITIITSEFREALKQEGVEELKVEKGSAFNEEIHEAVEVVKGKKDGEILEVILTGWILNGEYIVRPAKVRVSKKEK